MADYPLAPSLEHSHSFRIGALPPVQGAERAARDMHAAHRYYNELVAIERWRRDAIARHWAEVGGYTAQLDRLAELREAVKALPKGEERKDLFKSIDALQIEIYELQRNTITENAQTLPERRRRERAKELRAEAKAQGKKLSPVELATLLDQEPDCITPRDQLRAQIAAEYAAQSKKVSGKTVNRRLREAGLVRPTDAIDEEAKRRDYVAYQASGVSFETRAIVSERFEVAVKDSYPDPPRFQAWEGRGVLGVSYVRSDKMTFADLLSGQDLWCRLEMQPDRPAPSMIPALSWSELLERGWTRDQIITHASRRGDRELERIERFEKRLGIVPRATRPRQPKAVPRPSGKRGLLHLRMATSEDRTPVWLVLPVYLPEPIPLQARISTVRVYVRRKGLHDVWHAVICASLDEPVRSRAPAATGAVAIDSCWRRLRDGSIRAGYWVDSEGNEGSIDVPESALTRLDRAEELEAVQGNLWLRAVDREDGMREHAGILADLSKWVAEQASLPEWLAEVAPHIPRWRSAPRLHDMIDAWRLHRFDGDEEIFARLRAWRERWRHLFGWSTDLRESAIRARREHYRKVAHDIAVRYETVLLRDFDMTEIKRRKPSEETDLVLVDDAVRSIQTRAASGELRECLKRAAKRKGRLLVNTEIPGLTTVCHACGRKCAWDRAAELCHECEHCGVSWDQHANIARNMLAVHGERFGSLKTSGSARRTKKTSKRNKNLADRAGTGALAE